MDPYNSSQSITLKLIIKDETVACVWTQSDDTEAGIFTRRGPKSNLLDKIQECIQACYEVTSSLANAK